MNIIHAADRARAAYTKKNAGKEGYSLKALEQIANGTYRKNQMQNKVPELKPNTQAKMPTKTTTKATGNLRDQGYPSSRSYNRKNLSDRGYTGSQQTRQIDFNHVLKNDKVFGGKGVFSGNMLKEDLKARRKGKQYGTNETYYKRFGMSADEVLDQYEKYMKGKEREKAEKHPILTTLKDIPSAPDRSIASGLGTAAKKFFPNSDLDELLNSDAIQGKVKDVQERRDYIQDSRNVSDTAKGAAQIAGSLGDRGANLAAALLMAGTGMPAQVVGGATGGGGILATTGAQPLAETVPGLLRALNGIGEYGQTAQEKRHELERRGYDADTAVDLANAEGLASGAAAALMTGGVGNALGEAQGLLPSLLQGAKVGAGLGGGRQAASELIEANILGDQSEFGKAKQKYLAQGMSDEEAILRALGGSALRAGGSAAAGGLIGGILSGLGYGLSNLGKLGKGGMDGLNEYFLDQDALPMNESDLIGLPQNEIPDIPALEGVVNPLASSEIQAPAIQMPGTNSVIPLTGTNGTIELPDLNAAVANSEANKVVNQAVAKNPTLTISAEQMAQAKTRHKELSKELVALNKDIAKQQELFDSLAGKKSKGAERKAAGQKLSQMKQQAKAIQKEKSELSYQMKGEERPYKRYMQDYDRDAYNAIYGMDGIMGKLDYATHFAGDTPEAIALRDEIKKIINDTVQSGEFPNEADLWNKVEQLDNIARTTKQPFTSTKGKNYDYDTFFAPSNTDEYSGLNMDVVNGYHSALRSHSNKAVTDRITDALNSDTFNPVTITSDNGQQYRIEKGDEGFNLITLGEDGNPVWLDKYKTPNDLFKKLNKIEKGGVKLLDKALSEQSVPQVAGETASVSRSYKDLIPENAYFNSDSFRALADNAKEVDQKLTNLKNTRTQLEELLAKETIGPKPEEEWTPDEYIKSLGFLGEKPMLYTPEGEKIRKSIANVDNEIHTLRAREEEIREGKTALKNKASKEQLANYTFKAPTPATQTEYPGFDITKATHNDEVQDAINNGTAFIAEMSPLEYLDRAAHEIFTDSTLESTIMSANSLKEVSQYADAMRNGAQFPILDLRYNSKSGRGQEGLTRALAAYEAGIDKVPVAIIGEPSLNPYNGRPDDIEIDDYGIPESDIDNAVAESMDNALTPEEIDYLNNHMETLDDEIVPIEETGIDGQLTPEEIQKLEEGLAESERNYPGEYAAEAGVNAAKKNYVDINAVPDADKPRVIQETKNKVSQAYSDFLTKTENKDTYKNQVKAFTVPTELADMLYQASGGTKDISNKVIAFDLAKMAHEIPRHSNQTIETSRDQIAYGKEILDKVIDATLNPDIVENISNGTTKSQRGAFAIVKKENGYIVVVENIGGKNNPNVVPTEIIHMTKNKLDKALNSGKSIADIVYENDDRVGDVAGNQADIKNRVTAATYVAKNSPLSQTSKTLLPSPLSTSNVPQNSGKVNSVPSANATNTSSDESTGYWLRILGDPDFLAEQAQAQGVNPQTLVSYANKNLGYENIPRVTPTGGDVPPNNNTPHLDGMMPGDHTKTSQTYTNTGKNGGGWTEEEYNKYTDPSQFQYNDVSEQESVDNAIQMRTTEGREGFKNRVMAKEKLTGSEIDGLMMEWRDLTREARELEESGKDAAALWAEGVKVFRKVQEQESHNAQALQVLAKWSRNTPEGMLVEAENIVNGKTKPEQSKLQKELEKLTKGRKKFQFNDNFVAEFLKEAEEIQALTPNSPLAKDKMAELGRKVNRQLPSTLGEKLTSILMDNMLGNFRTLITRNAGGNVGLNAIEQLIQRPVAAGIDMLASVRTGKRTQAGLSREGLADYIHGFSKGLKDELHDLKTGLHTARTGENTVERAIQANRHVFREGGPMDRWDSLIKNGLSVGDRPFYEAVYNQTLGDYKRLRSSGKMGDVVQGLSDTDFNKYAETAAKLNALAAVYQNDSKLADALLGFKKSIGDLSRGIVGVDVLSQFSMPFVKTPANVVDVGVSYSPIGVVRNAFRTGKEIKDEAFDQNRFANETARNILGTAGLTAGGIALAKSGVLSGAYSEDKDEKQAQKEAGEQEYAWNVPEVLPGIGGKQMDISWLPAVGANLVSAAAAYDAYEKGEGNPIQNLIKGAEAGGQALFDQSMFQGLQRLFGTGESYNSDEGIVANMANVVKSGLSQFVPSLARQVGQVMDPYQRDVGNSNEGMSFGPLDDYGINNIANTIPKVREKALAPKVNTSGELMKENQGRNVGMKVLEDMILPGKITDVDYSRLSEEAMRLSNLTTNNTAFLPKTDRKSVDTETHTLSNQEWVDYQQKYYKTLTNAGEKLLDSTYYKNAETSEQEKMLANTYSDLRSAINSEYNGKEVDGAAKRYIDAGGGEKGVLEVLKYEMNSIEANKLDMTVPTYEKKQAEYPGGAKKYAENKKKADALGLTVDTYDKKEAEYQGGAKQYAADKKKADELGITVDQFNKAKNNGGAEKFAADKKAAEQVGFVTKDGTVQTKEYQKAIDKAGKQWRKMETDLPVLVKSGLDKSAIYTYGNALNSSYASTINPSQYAREYNMINTNKDNGMTQNEVLDYLNKGSYTQEEANRLWTIYGDGWKQVPVLKGGKWSKKKKK